MILEGRLEVLQTTSNLKARKMIRLRQIRHRRKVVSLFLFSLQALESASSTFPFSFQDRIWFTVSLSSLILSI